MSPAWSPADSVISSAVAGEALEFVDGEDDGRLGRGLLELVGQRERLLQLGPDLDAGTLD